MIAPLFQHCPACQHRFVPWTAWKISRWSCIACPACQAKLNRKFDLRVLAISIPFVIALGAAIRLAPTTSLSRVLVLAGGIVVFYFIDVCTVRLVQPKSYRGISGYEM
jgi:prepilin signal peptidase PulO-like enzyme (type II secretory pathway)